MTMTKRERSVLKALEEIGDPRPLHDWPQDDPDYVVALDLRPEDGAFLAEIARRWAEDDAIEGDNDRIYAPIHAWRAAAQLGAPELVDALLDILDPLIEGDDDWALEEFPDAFALVGEASLGPLLEYTWEASCPEFALICAIVSLREVAGRLPEAKAAVAEHLAALLDRYEDQTRTTNAFLILSMQRLGALEHGELIERAFAADRVDINVLGNWSQFRAEAGLPDHGIVPEALASKPLHADLNLPDIAGLTDAMQAPREDKPWRQRAPGRRRYKRRKRKSR